MSGAEFWLLFLAGFLVGLSLGAVWALLWRQEAERWRRQIERTQTRQPSRSTVRRIHEAES